LIRKGINTSWSRGIVNGKDGTIEILLFTIGILLFTIDNSVISFTIGKLLFTIGKTAKMFTIGKTAEKKTIVIIAFTIVNKYARTTDHQS